jgi:steroid 5-alpha reductase family enzyme
MRLVSSRRAGALFVVVAYLAAALSALMVARALSGLHPIWVAAIADLVATAVVFAFSVLLDNSSVYDPYWSVAPVPIVVYWAASAGLCGARQVLIIALVVLWGARLTVNWAVRWRGPDDEDFRYAEIRAKTGRAYWPASFASIHLMPTVWVFLGLLPLHWALTRTGFGVLDAVAAALTMLAIAIETIADLQLRRYLRSPHEPAGVLGTGLWGRCRHPNYLGEVLFWWGLFLFGVAASPTLGPWTLSIIGPMAITALFVFVSVPWMDRRMLARHPGWAEQMKKLPSLWPRW